MFNHYITRWVWQCWYLVMQMALVLLDFGLHPNAREVKEKAQIVHETKGSLRVIFRCMYKNSTLTIYYNIVLKWKQQYQKKISKPGQIKMKTFCIVQPKGVNMD